MASHHIHQETNASDAKYQNQFLPRNNVFTKYQNIASIVIAVIVIDWEGEGRCNIHR